MFFQSYTIFKDFFIFRNLFTLKIFRFFVFYFVFYLAEYMSHMMISNVLFFFQSLEETIVYNKRILK